MTSLMTIRIGRSLQEINQGLQSFARLRGYMRALPWLGFVFLSNSLRLIAILLLLPLKFGKALPVISVVLKAPSPNVFAFDLACVFDVVEVDPAPTGGSSTTR